jgi:hypothetical protein
VNFPKERPEKEPIQIQRRKKNPVVVAVEKTVDDCINDPELVVPIIEKRKFLGE